MSKSSIEIDVPEVHLHPIQDEEQQAAHIKMRLGKYEFSTALRNTGNTTAYEAKVHLKSNCPIDVKEHDADFILDHEEPNAVSFRLSTPIHPKEPARNISWFASAKAFLHFQDKEDKKNKITIDFGIYSRDCEPMTWSFEYDGEKCYRL